MADSEGDSRKLASGQPGSFVWPPRPVIETEPDVPADPPQAAPPPSIVDRLGAWWTSIEESWLDPVALPLPRRASAEAWAPDAPDSYCDRCGRDIGAYEASEFGCARCAHSRLPWNRFVRLGRYEEPLSTWIAEVKFTRWRVLGFELGRLLGRRLRDAGWVATPGSIVVPVPSTWRRRLTRGIDHAAVIARGVAMELRLPMKRVLRRRHRPSQRSVAPSERERNVARSFWRSPRANLTGRSIVLIDDVMTTGATLRGSARALSAGNGGGQPGAIWAAVLGVTPGG